MTTLNFPDNRVYEIPTGYPLPNGVNPRWPSKSEDESFDYKISSAQWYALTNDPIAQVIPAPVDSTSTLSISRLAYTGQNVSYRLSGGTRGIDYSARFLLIFLSGQELEVDHAISVLPGLGVQPLFPNDTWEVSGYPMTFLGVPLQTG